MTLDPALAKRWNDQLTELGVLDELTAASRRPFRGRPHVNLMMVDAY